MTKIYIDALFYLAISILLLFASIFKLKRLVKIYITSNFKLNCLIKNQLCEFFLLDFLVLLAIFISFYFHLKKENFATLFSLVILSIFYVSLLLRNIKVKINYKETSMLTKFIFTAHFLIYMIFQALFIFLFGIVAIFYVSFFYTFFIFYIFILRIYLDRLYLLYKQKKYIKKINNYQNYKNVYFVIGKSSNSFKNIFITAISKKYNFKTDVYNKIIKAEILEQVYYLRKNRNLIFSVESFDDIKQIYNENFNYIILENDNHIPKNMKNENSNINFYINKSLYKLTNNESNDYYIKQDEDKFLLYKNKKNIKTFTTTFFSNYNLKILSAVHTFCNIKQFDYQIFENNEQLDYFKKSFEEGIYLLEFNSFICFDIIYNELNKIKDKKILGLIDLTDLLALDIEYIKKLAKFASYTFDEVIFAKKNYNKLFLNNTVKNKKLKRINFIRFKEDAVEKAFTYNFKKPYIIVRINFKKEI